MFDHADADDLIERLAAQVAVVAQFDAHLVADAGLGDAALRFFVLAPAQRNAERLRAELLRGANDQRAPAATDVEQPFTRTQPHLAQRVIDLRELRLVERLHAVVPVAARIDHARIEERAVERDRLIVVEADRLGVALLRVPLAAAAARPRRSPAAALGSCSNCAIIFGSAKRGKAPIAPSINSIAASMSPSMSIHFSTNARPGLRSSGGAKAARSANGSLIFSVKTRRLGRLDARAIPEFDREIARKTPHRTAFAESRANGQRTHFPELRRLPCRLKPSRIAGRWRCHKKKSRPRTDGPFRACYSGVLSAGEFLFDAALEARGRTQRFGFVRLLPRQVEVGPAEVAVRRGLLVDRAAQVEVVDDRRRTQIEVRADEFGDLLFRDHAGAERLDEHADRMRDADRVRDLHFAAFGEPGRDDVLRDVARRVRRRAVDLGRVLAGERAAAVARHPAVRVGDDLAAGQTGVALRAADDEAAGRVDEDAQSRCRAVPSGSRCR